MTRRDGTRLELPELCLVALVGVSGSGKSTFARTHFAPTQVLSSDAFRALVADDENDQSASADAFDALHFVAGRRLRAGRLTVVDATNLQTHAREALVRVAREHDVLPVAIVLDVPEEVCWERTQARTDRPGLSRQVLARMGRDLRRSVGRLGREGFRAVHVLRGVDQVAGATLAYQRLFADRRELTGPFDIVGDVHGCRAELEELLTRLGWEVTRDADGRPVGARHPAGRTAVFVGDLVDRGPDSPGVLRLVMGMVAGGTALCVPGNHEHKLLRKLRGRNVQATHGLAETLEQLAAEPPEFGAAVAAFIDGLVSHFVLDGGRLVVAHAGLKEAYHGRASGRVRAFALYGETTGETDEYGLPVRYPWARDYRGAATVVYGHTPTPEPEWVNNTICIDTGCAFGGALTALRYPERELVSVPAQREHYPPTRPLAAARPGGAGPDPSARGDATLNLADVAGRRHLDTGYGRITVPAENAAAALEVMSRFAVDPRWLVWLPPTMAPCSSATVEGFLEHPVQALADYRAAGVNRVVCEEKHMGSRAVVLVCRDAAAAARFGPGTGAIWTRTGRPFFADPATTEALLADVRAAATAADLWAELDTGWLLLDCELLPWSAKAETLIREQFANVGAAGRAALPAALGVLDAAADRGVGVPPGLRDRLAAQAGNLTRFAAAYRCYVRPTDGLVGVTLAPFAVLATAGASHAGRDHGWHLGLADRLAAADPRRFTPTRRLVVDLADAGAEAAATRWWLDLTADGGEGAVVKPYAGPAAATAQGRLLQPGVKCRGREYLRIIYGPDYTDPDRLAALRRRPGLGRKRAMALREHQLGLAALDRLAAGAPLWRVHELVFAVLAAESEPVDPRL